MSDNKIEIIENKKRNVELENSKVEEIYRVTVTKSADEALEKIIRQVNENFEAGKVNRSQVVTWILLNFSKNLSDSVIQEIRGDHFDELALLESLFKKAKKTGKIPSDLKNLLMRQSGFDAPSNKRARDKSSPRLTDTFINDETQK
jgi:hypothetical protein